LLAAYNPIGMVGYCALIALGLSNNWSWLPWWFGLWTPIVDLFRQFIPVFDHFETVLAAKGVPYRAVAIEHLLAFGWTFNPPCFIFVVFSVLRLSETDWVKFVTNVSSTLRAIGLFFSTFAFLFAFSWTVFGFGLDSNNPMYAMHKYNWALLGIGIYFYGSTLFGVSALICFRGLLVEARSINRDDIDQSD
jgi:hypothetical protein